MNRTLIILLLTLVCRQTNFAQTTIDTSAIKKQLYAIFERDQKTRTKGDSTNFVRYIDSTNLVQIETLVNKYGWLNKSFVGGRGNQAAFYVIQHSELETQVKYLPIIQASVYKGESNAYDLAMLQDRILMRQEKKQIYGSQVVINKTTGAPEFYPIEDEKNVNERRAKVGLGTIEEYAKHFDINYTLPTNENLTDKKQNGK